VSSRIPSNLAKQRASALEPTSSDSMQRLRILLLAAAVMFPGWFLVLMASLPTATYFLTPRLVISVIALSILGLSYRPFFTFRHIERMGLGLAFIIVAVLGQEVYANNLSSASAIGYIVAAFGVALAFESQKLTLSYLAFAVAVSLFVGGKTPQVPKVLFIAANCCTMFMAGMAFRDKHLLLKSLKARLREQEVNRMILGEVQKVGKMGGWSFAIATQSLWWSDQTYAIHEVAKGSRIKFEDALGFVAPEARYLVKSAIRSASERGVPFQLEVPLDTAMGRRIWVRITCSARVEDGVITRLIGSMQDTTSEKHLSDELVAREAYSRAVIDAIPGFVSWTDSQLHYGGVNRALADSFKLPPEEFIGKPMGFMSTTTFDPVTEFMREVFAADDSGLTREVRISDASAEERYVLLSAKKYQDGKEAVLIGLDITDRKRSERELTEQKDLLGQILDHIPHGIYAKDIASNYRYVMWNSRMETMTGRQRQSLINHTDTAVYLPKEADMQRQIDSQVIANRTLFDAPEELLPTLSGDIPTHTMRIPVFDAKGVPLLVLGVVEDIRERKANEQLIQMQQTQLVHASKMSMLGEMSGGVAHEINNPLTVIMGFANRLTAAISGPNPDQDEVKRYAEKIVAMTERIAKIVRGLKTFAREASQDPFEQVVVKSVIADTLELCHERFLNNGVRLELPNAHIDATIECRAVQISQVLVNLLNNAYDAVQTLPDKWVRLDLRDLGDAVLFSVTDSGKGIADDVAKKMLNPFFTTKAVGQGTGLGLSISRGIVESHCGTLYYDSSTGHTCFVFVLPKQQFAKSGLRPPVAA